MTKTTIDTVKVNMLIELSNSYLFNQPDSSIYFGQEAKKIVQKIGNLYQYSLSLYKEGIAYRGKGELAKAFELLNQSLKIAETQNNPFLIAQNIKGIGLIYFDLFYFDKALEYFHKALEMFRKIPDYEQITIVNSNLGKIYIYLQNYQQAEKHLIEAKTLAPQYAPYFQSFALLCFGEMYLRQNQYKESAFFLNRALIFAKKFNDKQDVSSIFRLLAELNFKTQKIDSALYHAKKSLEIVQNTQMKENIYLSCLLLGQIFETQKNFEQSLKYQKLYTIYRDSVLSIIAKNSLLIFDSERKKEEIKVLKAKNEYQLLLNYIFIAIILLILGLALFGYLNHTRIRKVYQKLQKAYIDVQEKKEKVIHQNEELKQFQEKITHLNNHLEQLVQERTLKIQQKNKQLTDYAFFNAHKLRAPIATIKGLNEVLKLNPTIEEQSFIFTQIIIQINQLDEIVKKSQQMLNQDQDEDNDEEEMI